MSRNKPQMKFSDDRLLTDEVLTTAAELIEQEIEAEIEERENRDVAIPEELDHKLLEMARKLDHDRKVDIKKRHRKTLNRIAAIFLLCLISIGTITVGSSEALRLKIYNLFSNDQTGSITFRNNEEADAVGSWNGFWYPTYLPEGFNLVTSEEGDHFLLYVNKKEEAEINVYEIDSRASLSLDDETSSKQEIKIEQYNGYLFSNDKTGNKSVVWLMDKKTIITEFSNVDISETLKVIDGMKYINE